MAEVSALDQTISARRRQTRSSIYRYLYEAGVPCSKQQIAAALGLSLPTVYQNLTELARPRSFRSSRTPGSPRACASRGSGCASS